MATARREFIASGRSSPDPKTGCYNKLAGIKIIDFGRANMMTCAWRTAWCADNCYATKGNYHVCGALGKAIAERLAWMERQPPQAFYDGILRLPQGIGLRIGRSGDAANAPVVEAIIQALIERPDIRWMWPTRAWRCRSHPSWRLIERHLPGKVLLSVDPATPERPPSGWPIAGVRLPPDFEAPRGVRACPHYLTNGRTTCRTCWACFTTTGRQAPEVRSIAFHLHATAGKFCMRLDCKGQGPGKESGVSGLFSPGLGAWCAPGDDV
jgi:hypothetical protein